MWDGLCETERIKLDIERFLNKLNFHPLFARIFIAPQWVMTIKNVVSRHRDSFHQFLRDFRMEFTAADVI